MKGLDNYCEVIDCHPVVNVILDWIKWIKDLFRRLIAGQGPS